jgi:hypothetical protein
MVCPWNKENTWYHGAAAAMIKWSGFFRWLLLRIDNRCYWKNALTNPARHAARPQNSGVSFAKMLEVLGQKRIEDTPGGFVR